MSATSDKLRDLINEKIQKEKNKMNGKVDAAISLYRAGSEGAEEVVNQVEQGIDDAEEAKQQSEDAMERIESIKQSFDASRKAAEATEKSSTIGSALNPAAAAVAFVQKHIIAKLKVELKDIDDELKVAPRILDNLDAFIKRTRKKIQREKARYEAKKRIMEENKKMLS